MWHAWNPSIASRKWKRGSLCWWMLCDLWRFHRAIGLHVYWLWVECHPLRWTVHVAARLRLTDPPWTSRFVLWLQLRDRCRNGGAFGNWKLYEESGFVRHWLIEGH
jgi:hypothetical protein